MIEFETNVLPVIDEEGCVLGDLRFSEMLQKTIEVSKQQKP